MTSTFVETLLSVEAHATQRERLAPQGPLIGGWDFDWIGHEEDGSTWTVPAECR
jgi:hypothetical protein